MNSEAFKIWGTLFKRNMYMKVFIENEKRCPNKWLGLGVSKLLRAVWLLAAPSPLPTPPVTQGPPCEGPRSLGSMSVPHCELSWTPCVTVCGESVRGGRA